MNRHVFLAASLAIATGCNSMVVSGPPDASSNDSQAPDSVSAPDASTTFDAGARRDEGTDVPRTFDAGEGDAFDAGAPPDIGPIVRADPPPPPISGGTLIVLRDGVTGVASDPDRDVVWFVDLPTGTVTGEVLLDPNDEPGRLAEDASGRVHIVLRRGGAIVTVDSTSHTILARRSVCSVPRGIAFDSTRDAVLVACASGELITLPAAGGAATSTLSIVGDLRDVVVDRGSVFVSRFRSAELLQIASDGTSMRTQPPDAQRPPPFADTMEPSVAWRTVARPGGGVLMLHQRATSGNVVTAPGGYGGVGMCPANRVLTSALTTFDGVTVQSSGVAASAALAIDVAADSSGNVAIASPTDPETMNAVMVAPLAMYTMEPCGGLVPPVTVVHGQPTAVAFTPDGLLVVQTREPPTIQIVDWHMNTERIVALPGASREDSGQRLFHRVTSAAIACASCHPEGGDDGRVWTFDIGSRRTQSLRGGISGRAPFHWTGDQPDFATLVHSVFALRMSGGEMTPDQVSALANWLDSVPQLPAVPPVDTDAVVRGRALFESPYVGCTSCHTGTTFTTNMLTDVGTGGTFKVPSLLGVRWRAPYMHNGCATTLTDRFGPCGGTMHGATTGMSATQIADLVAYLETL